MSLFLKKVYADKNAHTCSHTYIAHMYTVQLYIYIHTHIYIYIYSFDSYFFTSRRIRRVLQGTSQHLRARRAERRAALQTAWRPQDDPHLIEALAKSAKVRRRWKQRGAQRQLCGIATKAALFIDIHICISDYSDIYIYIYDWYI